MLGAWELKKTWISLRGEISDSEACQFEMLYWCWLQFYNVPTDYYLLTFSFLNLNYFICFIIRNVINILFIVCAIFVLSQLMTSKLRGFAGLWTGCQEWGLLLWEMDHIG